MGPVIDQKAQKKILQYVKVAEKEGKVLYKSEVPAGGCYVPLTIVEGITPQKRLARKKSSARAGHHAGEGFR